MARYGFVVDTTRCIGCNFCSLACKVENNIPDEIWWTKAYTDGGEVEQTPAGEWPDNLSMAFMTVGCQHCDNPSCVKACPVGATYKDADTGIVRQDMDKCIGCRNCVLACPYGAVDIVTRPAPPEPDAASEQVPATCAAEEAKAPKPSARDRAKAKKRRRKLSTVVKCDLCVDHADGPACVAACPTKALRLIDPQMLERGKQAKRKAAARAAAAYSTIELNADLDEGE